MILIGGGDWDIDGDNNLLLYTEPGMSPNSHGLKSWSRLVLLRGYRIFKRRDLVSYALVTKGFP